jgi:putative ABC transport system permease protein
MLDSGAGATRYSMMILAAVIAFGIVYSTARIALSERSRDLASLRVLGFTGGETAFVLLGELALVVLVALPLGALGGALLASAIAAGFSTDIYQIPATPSPASLGFAALAVVMPALVSGVLVRIDLARLDLVSALKTRE